MENKKLIWLCVDSNGDEKLTSNIKGWQRFYRSKYSDSFNNEEANKVISYNDILMNYDHWIEYHDKNEEGPKTGFLPHWVYLPKGTINKILGYKLTWNDEPVKIEE